MLKVGITGGIGSGKSTVCKVFEVLGIPIYYADDRAKYLMQHDNVLIAKLKEAFGQEIYSGDKLNRALFAGKVFNNKYALEKLNQLVHPVVFKDAENWHKQHSQYPYTLKEAALLIETGSYKQLDKLIVVDAPETERIKRVMQRDGSTKEEVLARMKNQLSDTERMTVADYVIHNYAPHNLIEQVMPIHRELMALSQ